MARLLPISLALLCLATSSCGSDPADPAGTGGTTGGTGGTTGGTGGAGTGGMGGTGVAGAAAGTSGSGGAAGAAPSKDVPTDQSQAGLEAFLSALDYRSATWAAASTAPREPPVEEGSPHGLVQTWFNKTMRQSNADGHGVTGNPHVVGSMVVKEFYTGAAVVGRSVMLRQDAAWLYYCTATEGSRCFSGSGANAVTYQTTISNCACHGGGSVITPVPAP